MTAENRNKNARVFADRVDAAASNIGAMRDVLAQLSGVDARLKQQIERMERTEKQINAALGLLQNFSQASLQGGQISSGFGAPNTSETGQNGNGRNQQQWQASLARLVFGNGGSDGNIQ